MDSVLHKIQSKLRGLMRGSINHPIWLSLGTIDWHLLQSELFPAAKMQLEPTTVVEPPAKSSNKQVSPETLETMNSWNMDLKGYEKFDEECKDKKLSGEDVVGKMLFKILKLDTLIKSIDIEAKRAIDLYEKKTKKNLTFLQRSQVNTYYSRAQTMAYCIRDQMYEIYSLAKQELFDGIFKGLSPGGGKKWEWSLRDILEAKFRQTERWNKLKECLRGSQAKQSLRRENLTEDLTKWQNFRVKFVATEQEYRRSTS